MSLPTSGRKELDDLKVIFSPNHSMIIYIYIYIITLCLHKVINILLFLAGMPLADCMASPAFLFGILLWKLPGTLCIFPIPPAVDQPLLGAESLEFVWLLMSWSFRMICKKCNEKEWHAGVMYRINYWYYCIMLNIIYTQYRKPSVWQSHNYAYKSINCQFPVFVFQEDVFNKMRFNSDNES